MQLVKNMPCLTEITVMKIMSWVQVVNLTHGNSQVALLWM